MEESEFATFKKETKDGFKVIEFEELKPGDVFKDEDDNIFTVNEAPEKDENGEWFLIARKGRTS